MQAVYRGKALANSLLSRMTFVSRWELIPQYPSPSIVNFIKNP